MRRNRAYRAMLADTCAGSLGGDPQCGCELAIVDLSILGTEHRTRQLAGEVWLAPPSRRPRSTAAAVQVSVGTRVDGSAAPDRPRSGPRPDPLRAQPDLHSGRPLQLGGEGGQRAWLSRPSVIRASSPGSASQQAASIPAAAWLAPAPAVPLSNTATGTPRAASRQAMPSPMTPAPMTTTLGCLTLRAS